MLASCGRHLPTRRSSSWSQKPTRGLPGAAVAVALCGHGDHELPCPLSATPRARRPGCQRPARQGCVRGRARNGASGAAAHRRGPVRTVAVPGRLRHPVAAPGKLAQRGVTGRDRSSRTRDAQLTGPACTWDGRNLEPGWMVRALDPRPGWPAHRAAGGGPCPAPGPQATDRLTGITSGRRSVSGDWSAGQGSVRRCAGAHPRRTDGIERARYAGGA
jgi:hypothetical protein